MTELEALAARLLVVGFPGRDVGAELAGLVERGVAGVVLFSRNVGSAAEVRELTRTLKRRAGRPLLVAIDQEGGKVARLRDGFTPLPPFRKLGASGDAALARELGELVGSELAEVGVDWNFAPVLDVDTNPENPVIGERSLSRRPEEVARLGLAFAEGLMAAGVAPCGKHFPGHGDTRQDSHFTLPRLSHSKQRLDSIELVPFAAAAAANLPSLMTAHVVFEALEPDLPASMSEKLVGGVLRRELGYTGVVVTDDLEMKAIADHYPIEEVAQRAVLAGVDALLCCHTADLANRAISAIVTGVQTGSIPRARLEQAAERMARFALRWAGGPERPSDPARLASARHLALAERLRSMPAEEA